ncbi:FkbM family methyltransferase [Helicobacter sp.]|uniref:FkbM family methyltransferase n=2 Tax=Helicobacter sp. TaxID=218 RepID=UPI0037525D9B|nr:FkbM family methyltransferase [Helicobacter sp.]
MLSISRSGSLHREQWYKISLDIFGRSILAREKIIIGYKGGGIVEVFVKYQIFGRTIYKTIQNFKDTSYTTINIGYSGIQAQLAKDIATDQDINTKILNLCKGLDEKSIETLTTIISRLRTAHIFHKKTWDMLTEAEYQELNCIRMEFYPNIHQLSPTLYAYKNYFLPTDYFGISVFWHEFSLKKFESKTLLKIKHRNIIDAGSMVGDSALIFQKYTDKNIYAFEPTNENYEFLLQTIKLNNATRIIPVKKALGSEPSQAQISIDGECSSIIFNNNTASQNVEVITLDSFVHEHNLEVGFIKVDIEGFEQEFLKGAKQTITEQKPAMLISIYHQASDFFEIKPMIESWNLGYSFKIIKDVDHNVASECALFCEVIE